MHYVGGVLHLVWIPLQCPVTSRLERTHYASHRTASAPADTAEDDTHSASMSPVLHSTDEILPLWGNDYRPVVHGVSE